MASKIQDSSTLSLLREPRWSLVRAALDKTVREGKITSATRDALVRPAETLNRIGKVAPAALGSDSNAATELGTLLGDAAESMKRLPQSAPDAPPPSQKPGLVDLGVLLIAGLATIRVRSSDSRRSAEDDLSTLYGLAVAVVPLAVVAGSLADDATTTEVAERVHAVTRDAAWQDGPEAATGRACTDRIFVRLAKLLDERASFSFHAPGTIESVSPSDAKPGRELQIHGHFPSLETAESWPSKLHVYFASTTTGERIEATPKRWGKKKIKVTVPSNARVGSVELVDDEADKKWRAFRAQLWEDLAEASSSDPCLPTADDARVKNAVLGLSSEDRPPRPPTAIFDAADPTLDLSSTSVGPEYVRPRDPIEIEWGTSAASGVIVDPGRDFRASPKGTSTFSTEGRVDSDVAIFLTPYRWQMGMQVLGAPAKFVVHVRALAKVARNADGSPAVALTQGRLARETYDGDRSIDVVVRLDPPTSLADVVVVLDGESTTYAQDPKNPGVVAFSIDPSRLHDQLTFTVVPKSFPDALDADPITIGPLAVAVARGKAMMVVRPTVLVRVGDRLERAQVSSAEVQSLKDSLEKDLGISLELAELPWIDDALAVLTSHLDDPGDPRVAAMMEELALAASRTPGFEDAVWLALVPKAPSPQADAARIDATTPAPSVTANPPADGFGASCRSVVAAALVVADVDGALARITALHYEDEHDPNPSVRPVAPRLRLSGRVASDGTVSLDPSRVEARAASFGTAAYAGLDAYAVDRWGRTLWSAPFECVRAAPPQAIVALLPVDEEVASVEIRKRRGDDLLLDLMESVAPRDAREGELVATVMRYVPRPSLSDVDLKKDVLHWRYSHPLGARGELFIELTHKPKGATRTVTTAVLRLDPDGSSAELPLARFGAATMRLVTTDGWNFAASHALSHGKSRELLVARSLANGEFWADSSREDASVTWSLGTMQLESGPIASPLRLSPFLHGVLKLTVDSGGAHASDWRPVGEGVDAYDRP